AGASRAGEAELEPMTAIAVCVAAAATAILTLFSGFGLGTLLLPVFALVFPLEIAVAATAVVHLANNLFKLALLGRYARRAVVVRFGFAAMLAAFAGAWTLDHLARLPPIVAYELGGHGRSVTCLGLVLGLSIAVFAALELSPALEIEFGPRWLVAGGAASGFFGGVSRHQGALRAAFLARSGLDRAAFLGTSVLCACLVDAARLTVYGVTFFGRHVEELSSAGGGRLVVAACACAFAGSFVGTRLVRKVTLQTLQRCVAVGLLLLAVALGAGLV